MYLVGRRETGGGVVGGCVLIGGEGVGIGHVRGRDEGVWRWKGVLHGCLGRGRRGGLGRIRVRRRLAFAGGAGRWLSYRRSLLAKTHCVDCGRLRVAGARLEVLGRDDRRGGRVLCELGDIDGVGVLLLLVRRVC